ncbi:TonB-dependent receptor [Chryseolinea sp. Jin1]|uniref:TonB-dependent receptor n=2 Tax=Chryseolinea lacunae TaxID=2801331 RepID=A0ABS1KXC2_9BACT|nr:TonB-dependent receptor [Chryseolinea lacunae]
MIPLADSGGGFTGINLNDNYTDLYTGMASPDFAVKGTVTDEAGSPLPGVNVLVKGTSIGTVTDSNGNFSLNAPDENAILVFSFIGYSSKEIAVSSQSLINTSLSPDTQTLEEVVVIGYGTQKKSDLTGSVGSVKAEDIQERQLPSVSQALAGKVTGVAVNINSGRPGGQTNVRIRGFSSISTSNNPLYVIDGVIMPVGTQTNGSYPLNNAVDNINPSDIASMEVLKDASATAIYGARGANGVILITTKRGSTGGGKISYDMQMSVPTIGPNRVRMLNAKEFLATEQLGYDNIKVYDNTGWVNGTNTRRNPALDRTNPALFDANGNPLYDTDWFKESTQNKMSQNHQLSFTGGNKDNSYGVFVGYRDDNGLLLNSYLRRYSGRFVFDSQLKPWLKVGGSLGYNNQQENIVDFGTGGLNSVRMITEALPILPVRYPDGSFSHNKNYSPSMEGGQNPVDLMTSRKYILLSRTVLGNVYANFKLAEGLELRSTLGTNVLEREQNQYDGRPALETPAYVLPDNQKGSARVQNNRETFWSFENYLTYTKQIGDIHNIQAMAGISWQETNIFWFQARSQTFITDFLETNNLGSAANFLPSPPVESNRSRFSFNSYFGRVNYSLKEKYLVTVTGRMDGSSKFGESNKYAFFPSAALAWRVSQEPFLVDNPIISNLKVRTSYGFTGNSEITTYSALASLKTVTSVVNNAKTIGVNLNRLGNPDLKWEKTAQSDIGVELGLFQNRVNIEADLYYRKTTDMLLDAPLPTSSGYATIVRNVGSMENKGIELALNTVNVQTDNFTWSTTFNISINRNKVLTLATPAPIFGVGNPNFTNQTGVIMEGQPVGSFWGLVRLGTWGTGEAAEAAKYGVNSYRGTGKPILPGDVKYLDVNGDYQINDADRMIIGNGNPLSYGSFINTLKYKNFDLMLDLQYSYGNDVLNMTHHSGEDRTGLANSFNSVLNAWTPENQNTDVAAVRDSKAGYVSNVDTHWLEDGSFLRGRNLLLGYNFPSNVTERLKISRLRIYASTQNFFLKTKFSGNDPEVSTYTNPFAQGQTFFDYPKPTTYMFGVSLGL